MKKREPKKIGEAFQRGRSNNISKVVGQTIVGAKDVGPDSVELILDSGDKLHISGQTDKSPTAIYYKQVPLEDGDEDYIDDDVQKGMSKA